MNMPYLILSFCLTALSGLARLGLDINVNVYVHDEEGEPIRNASVYVAFSAHIDDEDPWKGQKDIDIKAFSDVNGKCSFSGKSLSTLSVGVQKERYYSSVQKYRLNDRDSKLGRWLPYERDVEIVLRKINNPIAMYAWSMYYEKYPVTTNEWAGFDMLMADWMPPHGNGKTEDVRFELQFNLNKLSNDVPLSVVTLQFPGKKNGVTALDDSKVSYQSGFEHPYYAPFEGYTKKEFIWETWMHDKIGCVEKTNTGSTNCFFRIRSKVDDDGNFIEGLYGKIRGPVDYQGRVKRPRISFSYYVNPTPNDLNMEFDPEKNLIKKEGIQRSVVEP